MSFKIRNAKQLIIITGLIVIHNTVTAQTLIIQNYGEYKKTRSNDTSQTMVNIAKYVPNIKFDLRYTTRNNFTGRKLYPPIHQSYMRISAAKALAEVQNDLSKKGIGLKIFDAYRPYSVTVTMWNLIKDERYVANPANGSGHNRGIAVDLTLIILSTGEELNMGTGFDNFTDSAHHLFAQLPESVLNNRLLLKTTMERFGFKSFDSEWWHYSYTGLKNAAVLDIPFKKLEKTTQY